jgi:hypothetical protein
MKLFLTSLGLLTAAHVALADVNYSIAKGQAHRAEDQSAAASGNQTTPPPGAPNTPSAPPMDPALQATMRSINTLRTDIAALNDTVTGKPDPAIKPSLLNDLTAGAQGTKPLSASVQKLAGHLMTALVNKKKMQPQQVKLARDIHAAFNGAHLAAAQLPPLLDDVKKILTDAGTPAEDAAQVADDLKQIAAETK